MAFAFNNLCPDTAEGLGRQGEGWGSLPSPVSIVRGKCLIISSLLAAIHCHPSCHHPSPWPISDGETERLGGGRMRADKYVESWTWYGFITLHTALCLAADCEGAGGAGASRHQWRATQRINISWQPTPVTPTLPPGVSRLHFRS